MILLSG